MKRGRLYYAAGGGIVGLFLCALGWGFTNFYLVAAGVALLASGLAWLTLPLPALA